MIKHSDIFDDLHESLSVQESIAIAVEKAKMESKTEGKIEGKIEGKVEGKIETIPIFLQIGLSVEQIAEMLELPFDVVQEASRNAPLKPQK